MAIAFVAAAMSMVVSLLAGDGPVDLTLRLAVPAGVMLLASAVLFAPPRSRTFYALVVISCAMSLLVLGVFGYRLTIRFLL